MEKLNQIKKKHIYISEDVHTKVKVYAAVEGLRVAAAVESLLSIALDVVKDTMKKM